MLFDLYTSSPVPTISVSILSHNHALKCTTLCSVIVKGRLASHDRLIHPTRGLQQPCHVNPDHTRDHATTPRPHRVYLSPAGETKWHGRSRPRLQSKNARTTTPSIEAPAGITASGLNTAPAQLATTLLLLKEVINQRRTRGPRPLSGPWFT